MTTSNPFTSGHILFVIASLGGGGAERVVADLCAHLVAKRWEVTVLTLSGDDPDAYELPAEVRRERIEIRRAARSLMNSFRYAVDHLLKMRRRIISIHPDVVVSFIDQTNVRVLACTIGTKVPVIISERVNPEQHPIPEMWNIARRLLYRRARAVVVQTEDIALWFRAHVPTRRLEIIPNAIRLELCAAPITTGSGSQSKEIVAVGRLDYQKGFDILLSAFAGSALSKQGWQLTILGEGQERQSLQAQIKTLGLDGSVTMPGHVHNVAEKLVQAQFFVLSSRYEGFPNALLEAMQLGVASASFDCPSGPRELIEHERNGLLISAGDSEELERTILRLANDPELRSCLGQAAMDVSSRFSSERVYGMWIALLDDTIN